MSLFSLFAQLWDWPPLPPINLLAATPVFVASRMDNHKASLEGHPEVSAGSMWRYPSAWRHWAHGARNTCAPQFALATSSLHGDIQGTVPNAHVWNGHLRGRLLSLSPVTAGGCWSAKNGPEQEVRVRAFPEEFASSPGRTKPTFLCSGTQWKSHLFSSDSAMKGVVLGNRYLRVFFCSPHIHLKL